MGLAGRLPGVRTRHVPRGIAGVAGLEAAEAHGKPPPATVVRVLRRRGSAGLHARLSHGHLHRLGV
eukprot:4135400-Lingulodinium_polyedra.AAC.1